MTTNALVINCQLFLNVFFFLPTRQWWKDTGDVCNRDDKNKESKASALGVENIGQSSSSLLYLLFYFIINEKRNKNPFSSLTPCSISILLLPRRSPTSFANMFYFFSLYEFYCCPNSITLTQQASFAASPSHTEPY